MTLWNIPRNYKAEENALWPAKNTLYGAIIDLAKEGYELNIHNFDNMMVIRLRKDNFNIDRRIGLYFLRQSPNPEKLFLSEINYAKNKLEKESSQKVNIKIPENTPVKNMMNFMAGSDCKIHLTTDYCCFPLECLELETKERIGKATILNYSPSKPEDFYNQFCNKFDIQIEVYDDMTKDTTIGYLKGCNISRIDSSCGTFEFQAKEYIPFKRKQEFSFTRGYKVFSEEDIKEAIVNGPSYTDDKNTKGIFYWDYKNPKEEPKEEVDHTGEIYNPFTGKWSFL